MIATRNYQARSNAAHENAIKSDGESNKLFPARGARSG